MKIAILRDDLSGNLRPDDQDNLEEAAFVENLLAADHETCQIPFYSDLAQTMAALKDFGPDLVFNLAESVCSQGGLAVFAPQILEIMRLPYTGNRTFAHLASADKALAKKILLQNGLPAPSDKYSKGSVYLLKAKTEHASIGLDDGCIIAPRTAAELQTALSAKEKETGLAWIAEEYIDGREFNVALLGNEVLPPAEMCFSPDFKGYKILTYEAKWNEDTDAYKQSRRSFEIEPEIIRSLQKLAQACKEALDLKGYTRIDFRMNRSKDLYIIDLNTNPCISEDSGFIAMSRRAGLSDKETIERIIKDAFIS